MTTVDWRTWLSKVGFHEPPEPSMQSLARLLGAYRRAVPFENLGVFVGQAPSTDVAAIADRILSGRRGGWCFEVNLLLADLLRSSGFEVRLHLARVGYRRPELGPLTHLALVVRIDDREWLVDAGFGGPGPLGCLPLTPGESHDAWGCRWQWAAHDSDGITLSRWMEGRWQRLYALAPWAVLPIDIVVASFFLSQWPMSPFKRMLICVAFDGQGYWCLEDRALVQRDVQWTEMARAPLRDADHLATVLEDRLGIAAPSDVCRVAWSRWSGTSPGP
jgi:N-hydroxyarylamine O-acetyltransferase